MQAICAFGPLTYLPMIVSRDSHFRDHFVKLLVAFVFQIVHDSANNLAA